MSATWDGARYLVTREVLTRAGHRTTPARAFGVEANARAYWIDERANASRLWVLAPDGYLGPCCVPYLLALHSYHCCARDFASTTAATLFRVCGDHPRSPYARGRIEDIGPIFAEQCEIDTWRRLIAEAPELK